MFFTQSRLLAIIIGLVCALVVFLVLVPLLTRGHLERDTATLSDYISERASAQHALFDSLITVHHSAQSQFERLYASLPAEQVETLFETHFPMHESGTRRSRDVDFDGSVSADGTLTYGMGAFLGGTHHDHQARRASVAAFLTVRSAGPGHIERFDNFYFNDEQRLVMFGPSREDRLEFYRHTAPADFSFANHPFVEIVSPAVNPMGRTACTSLTDLLYARDQRALTIGCHTPVRINGAHLGAFGTTLPVHSFLAEAVTDPSGREALVVSREGRIVAHPALFAGSVITDQDVAEVTAGLHLDQLVEAIVANGRPSGVIADPSGSGLAAFSKLEAPGWYLVVREPSVGTPITAWFIAAAIALLAGALVTFQIIILPAGRSQTRPVEPVRS